MVSARMAANLGALLGVAALSAGLSGCSDGVPPAAAALNDALVASDALIAGEAQLRFVNVSPTAPDLDLVVEEETALSNVAFGYVTDYVNVPAGEYDLSLSESSTGGGEPGTLLASSITDIAGDRSFTVVALDEATRLTTLLLEESYPASSNEALVRFVHAIPDAPPLTLSAIGDERNVLEAGVEFGSVSDYVAIDPNTTELEILATSGPTLKQTQNISIEVGKLYTVYALGLTRGAPEVDLAILEDTSDWPQL
ncbi:MAG: DUF4397 domain-containing protein [Cyanobacteria bacterium J06642_2]